MAESPNDRPAAMQSASEADPRVYIVVDGKKFPRPGLETLLAEAKAPQEGTCSCHPVVAVICTCNKVRVKRKVAPPPCACDSHVSCSCHAHTVRRGGCRCAPVH
jgi:hypothetical protein